MKYNDYPLPDEQLINVLSQEYEKSKQNSVKTCNVGVFEQNSKLSELYVYINVQTFCLEQLLKLNKNLVVKYDTSKHLEILKDMGVEICNVQKFNNSKNYFKDYLRCEAEIFKILTLLLFLENIKFERKKLCQIFIEQVENFNCVVNFKE